MYLGVSCFVLHISLYQRAAFVLNNFKFTFLQLLIILAVWASAILKLSVPHAPTCFGTSASEHVRVIMRRNVLTLNIVHLLVNKRRIYKNTRYAQFQERRLSMQSVQLYKCFSCCDGTLWLYRPVLSSPGCVIRKNDAAPSAVPTLAMMSTLCTKPVMLNHPQSAPPTSHLHIRGYVLVLTCFHLFLQSGSIEKGFPTKFSCTFFFSAELSQTPDAVTNIG